VVLFTSTVLLHPQNQATSTRASLAIHTQPRASGRMDTPFRVLYRHLRTIWHSARSLFLSIRFCRVGTGTDDHNATTNNTTSTTTTNTDKTNMTNTTTTTTTRLHRPPTPMPTSSFANRLATLSMAKTRAYQWARERARAFRAHMMRERQTITMQTKTIGTTSTKRTVYARKGAAVVGPGKEDVVGAMHKYDEEDAREAEDGEEEEEVDDRQGDANKNNDLHGFEALFKSLSSSPTLRLDAWRGYSSPFSHSQSLPSPASASTPALLTPSLLEPELLYALPSPTISCMPTPAPAYARAFPHVLRIHRRALATLDSALLPLAHITLAPARRALDVEPGR